MITNINRYGQELIKGVIGRVYEINCMVKTVV